LGLSGLSKNVQSLIAGSRSSLGRSPDDVSKLKCCLLESAIAFRLQKGDVEASGTCAEKFLRDDWHQRPDGGELRVTCGINECFPWFPEGATEPAKNDKGCSLHMFIIHMLGKPTKEVAFEICQAIASKLTQISQGRPIVTADKDTFICSENAVWSDIAGPAKTLCKLIQEKGEPAADPLCFENHEETIKQCCHKGTLARELQASLNAPEDWLHPDELDNGGGDDDEEKEEEEEKVEAVDDEEEEEDAEEEENKKIKAAVRPRTRTRGGRNTRNTRAAKKDSDAMDEDEEDDFIADEDEINLEEDEDDDDFEDDNQIDVDGAACCSR